MLKLRGIVGWREPSAIHAANFRQLLPNLLLDAVLGGHLELRLSRRIRRNGWSEHAESAPGGMHAA